MNWRDVVLASKVFSLVTCISFPLLAVSAGSASGQATETEESLVLDGEAGVFGGQLIVAERSEPKTFNPVISTDNVSRSVIRRLTADLVHINRETHETESSLAKSWVVTPDGRRYTLHLREGIRFSDGHFFDADDVVFTFRVYLDEEIHSPSRDLLIIGGEPIVVSKVDSHTVVFDLAQPYGAAERIFDSLAILPQHILERTFQEGKFVQAWKLSTPPDEIVGLGPFRLKKYVPGERVILERNPYYWKLDRSGHRLPYLDEVVMVFVAAEDTQVMRFQAGEIHLLSRLGADNYRLLKQSDNGKLLRDLGPGLEYSFLFFNLNDLDEKDASEIERKQEWFKNVDFRRAVSAGIDREALARLAYSGAATPLATHVTPGNKLWLNASLSPDSYSVGRARELLQKAGFGWDDAGQLIDASGGSVGFSILTSSSNRQRTQMATLIQEDMRKLGMSVQVVSMEFRAVVDRIFNTQQYEACLMALGSGDVDPTAETSVWLSSGATHLWRLGQAEPVTHWERETDRLILEQMVSTDQATRKKLYDRVQAIVHEYLPLIPLVSPNILVGADARLGNFRPAILDHYTLWNVEQLFLRQR